MLGRCSTFSCLPLNFLHKCMANLNRRLRQRQIPTLVRTCHAVRAALVNTAIPVCVQRNVHCLTSSRGLPPAALKMQLPPPPKRQQCHLVHTGGFGSLNPETNTFILGDAWQGPGANIVCVPHAVLCVLAARKVPIYVTTSRNPYKSQPLHAMPPHIPAFPFPS